MDCCDLTEDYIDACISIIVELAKDIDFRNEKEYDEFIITTLEQHVPKMKEWMESIPGDSCLPMINNAVKQRVRELK